MGSKCTFSRFEITIGFFSKISNPSISLLKGNYHHLKSFQIFSGPSVLLTEWKKNQKKAPYLESFYAVPKEPNHIVFFHQSFCRFNEYDRTFSWNDLTSFIHYTTQQMTFSVKDLTSVTAQKIKFSFKDFFSKCDQIRRKLRIWSHLLKKSLMENIIFCAMLTI